MLSSRIARASFLHYGRVISNCTYHTRIHNRIDIMNKFPSISRQFVSTTSNEPRRRVINNIIHSQQRYCSRQRYPPTYYGMPFGLAIWVIPMAQAGVYAGITITAFDIIFYPWIMWWTAQRTKKTENALSTQKSSTEKIEMTDIKN